MWCRVVYCVFLFTVELPTTPYALDILLMDANNILMAKHCSVQRLEFVQVWSGKERRTTPLFLQKSMTGIWMWESWLSAINKTVLSRVVFANLLVFEDLKKFLGLHSHNSLQLQCSQLDFGYKIRLNTLLRKNKHWRNTVDYWIYS